MRSICVYLGSSFGTSEAFADAVALLARLIALRNLRLVYGGSSLGTMGVLADEVKIHGGTVIGIMPEHLVKTAREKPSQSLHELHITPTMIERKRIMRKEADLFLVMPGGLGTLDEAVETWNEIRLGILDKPLGFFNPVGFFDALFEFVQYSSDAGFMDKKQLKVPHVSDNLEALLDTLIEAAG